MNWASVVKSSPEDAGAGNPAAVQENTRVAVVDTNALIRGFQLQRIANRAVTVKEVISEVRDKKTRDWLERLPFGIDVEEPDEESLKAVVKFARVTGDLSFLSEVDVKVIALARTLEKAHHGLDHVKDLPQQVKVQNEGESKSTSLVGWGTVPNPEDWVAVDELNEKEAQLLEGKTLPESSRILNTLEGLTLGESAATKVDDNVDLSEEAGAEEASRSGRDSNLGDHEPVTPQGQERRSRQDLQDGDLSPDTGPVGVGDGNGDQSDGLEGEGTDSRGKDEGGGDSWQVANAKGGKKKKKVVESEPEVSEVEVDDRSGAGIEDEGFRSSVACITSDFSMQNVLIQMGLRLVTPDGTRIKEVKRWAMRCSACFFVTKEVGRIFCPNCGNASLQRVELRTGPDGSEVYGVRTKHRLRGTKYSLPLPKGGKRNKDPILSEDVMNQRLKTYTAPKKDRKMMDVFSPEFGGDNWHKMAAAKQSIKELLPNRRNPNERRYGKRRK